MQMLGLCQRRWTMLLLKVITAVQMDNIKPMSETANLLQPISNYKYFHDGICVLRAA